MFHDDKQPSHSNVRADAVASRRGLAKASLKDCLQKIHANRTRLLRLCPEQLSLPDKGAWQRHLPTSPTAGAVALNGQPTRVPK
jgi:hypothetical protein